MTEEEFSVEGRYGTRIPARIARSGGDELLICLPGLRYTSDMPALYFVRRLFEAQGFDIVTIDYRYDRDAAFLDLPEERQLRRIGEDGKIALSAALAKGKYKSVTIVGKSLGTIAMGLAVPEMAELASARLIWLTPSLEGTGLIDRIISGAQAGFVAIGTDDPNYSPEAVAALRSAGLHVLVMDGADHGLERKGDISGSVAVLAELIDALARWLPSPAQRSSLP